MDDIKTIYTIGYTLFKSDKGIDVDQLFNTLRQYNVSYLIDVRSIPYSKQYPQCNADSLKFYGKLHSIPYAHMPELGAKASPTQDVFSRAVDIFDEDIYPISKSNRPEKTPLFAYEEIVDFRKFRNDEYFCGGIKRIETAYRKGFTLALMCSEKNPMTCHRYFLISKKLSQQYGDWLQVKHITQGPLGNAITTSNTELDKELAETVLNKMEIRKLDLFGSSFFESARIDEYEGDTRIDKVNDFCDRYWNLMHGWKKNGGSINNE